MIHRMKLLWADEEGWTTLEYAILVDLLAVTTLLIATAYGATVHGGVN